MKRLHKILALGLFLFASCSQDEVLNEVVKTATVSTRSTEDSVVSNNDYKVDYTLLQKYLKLTKKDADVQTITPLVREGDTLAYGVQYTQGWDFIAADQRLTPVMAYSKVGNFPQPLTEPIEGALTYIQKKQATKDSIRNAMWRFLSPTPSFNKAITRGGDYGVGMWIVEDTVYESTFVESEKLIPTTWWQIYPWDQCTPLKNGKRTKVGCTAVTAGQLIYFFRKNNHKNIAIPTNVVGIEGGIRVEAYDTSMWNNLAKTQKEYTTTMNTSAFLSYLGHDIMDLEFGTDKTSGNEERIANALTWAGIDYTLSTGYSSSTVLSNLKGGKPVGMISEMESGDRHSYIIDYYRISTENTYVNCYWDPLYEPTEREFYEHDITWFEAPEGADPLKDPIYKRINENTIENTFFSMNWGLTDGIDNGYHYIVSNYTTEQGYYYFSEYWSVGSDKTGKVTHMFTNLKEK
ncbi:MAG: C10 family peptidase [Bacteroides sp.]|nr:C10 family peptidase [Bacteroides sp.]